MDTSAHTPPFMPTTPPQHRAPSHGSPVDSAHSPPFVDKEDVPLGPNGMRYSNGQPDAIGSPTAPGEVSSSDSPKQGPTSTSNCSSVSETHEASPTSGSSSESTGPGGLLDATESSKHDATVSQPMLADIQNSRTAGKIECIIINSQWLSDSLQKLVTYQLTFEDGHIAYLCVPSGTVEKLLPILQQAENEPLKPTQNALPGVCVLRNLIPSMSAPQKAKLYDQLSASLSIIGEDNFRSNHFLGRADQTPSLKDLHPHDIVMMQDTSEYRGDVPDGSCKSFVYTWNGPAYNYVHPTLVFGGGAFRAKIIMGTSFGGDYTNIHPDAVPYCRAVIDVDHWEDWRKKYSTGLPHDWPPGLKLILIRGYPYEKITIFNFLHQRTLTHQSKFERLPGTFVNFGGHDEIDQAMDDADAFYRRQEQEKGYRPRDLMSEVQGGPAYLRTASDAPASTSELSESCDPHANSSSATPTSPTSAPQPPDNSRKNGTTVANLMDTKLDLNKHRATPARKKGGMSSPAPLDEDSRVKKPNGSRSTKKKPPRGKKWQTMTEILE